MLPATDLVVKGTLPWMFYFLFIVYLNWTEYFGPLQAAKMSKQTASLSATSWPHPLIS